MGGVGQRQQSFRAARRCPQPPALPQQHSDTFRAVRARAAGHVGGQPDPARVEPVPDRSCARSTGTEDLAAVIAGSVAAGIVLLGSHSSAKASSAIAAALVVGSIAALITFAIRKGRF